MTIGNDDHIRSFLADEARQVVAAAPSFDQAIGRLAPRIGERSSAASPRLIVLLAATLLLALALGTAIAVGSGLLRLPLSIDRTEYGIFEPLAGRILYSDSDGLWAVDPDAQAVPSKVQVTFETGVPRGWSLDGTRLLIARDGGLFVLHVDGSETAVTEQLGLDRLVDIQNATISPDGSRVVFVGLTQASTGGCCDYALYAVDADGGPAELLLEARYTVEDPTFSPDGTQIAYADGVGLGGSDHTV